MERRRFEEQLPGPRSGHPDTAAPTEPTKPTHLDARVHLHEVEALLLPQELDGADAHVADGARGVDGGLAHLLADLGGQRRRGRLLHQLLVAALHGAVALAQVDDVAVLVGQHLAGGRRGGGGLGGREG
jgi:hypothetical protein